MSAKGSYHRKSDWKKYDAEMARLYPDKNVKREDKNNVSTKTEK